MTRREVLRKLIGNHIQSCDCLACRKGGRVDQALTELEKLDLMEEEIEKILNDRQFDLPDDKQPWNINERKSNKAKAQAILSTQRKKRGEK